MSRAQMGVRILAHTVDPELVVASAARLCYSPVGPREIMDGFDEAGVESLVYKFSDGDSVSHLVSGPEDINLEASRATYADSAKQFILKADGTVRFEKIDELLDAMRRGGVQRVLLLLTGQRTAQESPS